MDQQKTINGWLEGLYRKAGYLTPEMVRDDARDENSPGHSAIFSMSIDDAAEAFYLERAHRTITSAKKYIVGADGTTYFERSYHAIPNGQGATTYTYYSVEDVQTDAEKLQLAIKEASKRLRDAERSLEFLLKIDSGKHARKTQSALLKVRSAQKTIAA